MKPIHPQLTKIPYEKMNHIKNFQKQNSLIDDGVIGKNTINMMMFKWKISSIEKLSHFLGQTDHETSGFVLDTENMSYRASRLLAVFPTYFRNISHAAEYAHRPKKLGDYVYGNRMGNNDFDGYFFRGRGATHTTGHDNYKALSKHLKDENIMFYPELVATKYFFESALFYFDNRKIWCLCQDVNIIQIKAVTRKVNGGYNGLQDRKDKTIHYFNIISKCLR